MSQPHPVEEPGQEIGFDVNSSSAAPATTMGEADMPTLAPMTPLTEPLGYMDAFLHWSDLLGLELDHTDFSTWLASSALNPLDLGPQTSVFSHRSNGARISDAMTGDILRPQHSPSHPEQPVWSTALQQTALNTPSPAPDVLDDPPFLLKHLQENVIPLMIAMPLGQKSPWAMLNMSVAVVTLGDLIFLNPRNIKHARLANMYGLLACSAIHLTLQPSTGTDRSIDHWQRLTNQAFKQAKEHMQHSLQNGTQMPEKAKYKDQLIALNILTEFALDTERLVRRRGFLKRKISQKVRLLHHVYTWLRIVGESTYVLHDHSPSSSFLDALRSNFQSTQLESVVPRTDEPSARLDDFLCLETSAADSDLNIDERKDKETSLKDIHLEDSRDYPETLYKQIYGIPETWLNLISQTTRLANVMETFRTARKLIPQPNFEAWETLQRRSVRLEYMICSLDRNHGETTDHNEKTYTSKARRHMLRALNVALVIFFYRRIRQVHPQILECQVDNVISELEAFRATLPPGESIGLGSIWPAFIAGCEDTDPTRRDTIMEWLDRPCASCPLAPFLTAKNIMSTLWRKQDECLAVRGEIITTWIDVAKQENIWPMFY